MLLYRFLRTLWLAAVVFAHQASAFAFFSELGEIVHSVIKHVPGIGTLVSIERANVAGRGYNDKRFWLALADALECTVRDILIISEIVEPYGVTLLHSMTESLTEKVIDIYHEEPPDLPKVKVNATLEQLKSSIFVVEPEEGHAMGRFFGSAAKGVYHYYGAVFVGTIKHPVYAWRGEKIRLDIPRGLYNGAPVEFTWKWTRDASGGNGRPEATRGYIRLDEGRPPRFGLIKRKAAGDWLGYDFWGTILGRDRLSVSTRVDNSEVRFEMTRVAGT